MKTLFLAVFLAACSSSFFPEGARPFVPLEIYATWWQEVEECAGLSRPFESVSWYELPHENPEDLGPRVMGAYHEDRIFIDGYYARFPAIVKHEILHALLDPVRGHPSPPFEKCELN